MLKSTSRSVAPVITKLFNMSTASGKLPKDWKSSLVVPIPKKGDHSDPSNYRPISLLPVLSKVLERHMSNLFYDHLLKHASISTKQWGFLQAGQPQMLFCQPLMTGTKLLTVVLKYVPSFLTFRKHLTVCLIALLLQNWGQLNINKFLLKWIVDYLTDRTQCIGVEGATSPSKPVLSGVPQGSVLGPLLFIIYIDGLTNTLSNSSMSLYADDLLLYRTIQSPTDYQTLQAELNRFTIQLDFIPQATVELWQL